VTRAHADNDKVLAERFSQILSNRVRWVLKNVPNTALRGGALDMGIVGDEEEASGWTFSIQRPEDVISHGGVTGLHGSPSLRGDLAWTIIDGTDSKNLIGLTCHDGIAMRPVVGRLRGGRDEFRTIALQESNKVFNQSRKGIMFGDGKTGRFITRPRQPRQIGFQLHA